MNTLKSVIAATIMVCLCSVVARAESTVELGEPSPSTNLVTSTPTQILPAHSGSPARVSIGISNFGTVGFFAWGGTNSIFRGGYFIPAGQTLFITFPSHIDNRAWYAATLSGESSCSVVPEYRAPN